MLPSSLRALVATRPPLIVALLAAAFACAESPSRQPNVVLITVDTLRADHLSTYGYERTTSLGLSQSMGGGVTFDNAISTSSWTAPAVASLMTALHPFEHQVRHGEVPGFGHGRLAKVASQEVLSDTVTTLAEALRADGYETFGLSTNPHLSKSHGFAQGIDQFVRLSPPKGNLRMDHVYADAESVNMAVAAHRSKIQASEKAFVWIHYLDPHSPYRAREPWLNEYVESVPGKPGNLPKSVNAPRVFERFGLDSKSRDALLEAYYDSEIAYLSGQIQELLEGLGLGDDALYVFTSDHGESFHEHGSWGHGTSLYEVELHVPLIFRFPHHAGLTGHIAEPVSLLDIMPTILDYVGVPMEIETESNMRGKLILDLETGAEEQYDLDSDPGEKSNLVGSLDPRAEKAYSELAPLLEKYLEAEKAARQSAELKALEPAAIRGLEALGYLEGAENPATQSTPETEEDAD
jgi:arylsulfatase A-like enzyme